MSRTKARNGILLTLLAALSGCATFEGGRALNILSTEEEIALGNEVAAEVEQQETLLDDAAVQAYVAQIGDRLARVASRQDVPYTFKVVDAADTVNAFALPGGNMYIYTGLMKLCEDEAELAAVMAHEIGHVAGHHHGESMTRMYGYELITRILLGNAASERAQLVTGLVGQAVTSRYSREQEREADKLGMEFLFRAGYPPDAMISLMNKMRSEEGKEGGGRWLPIFASHPPTTERLHLLHSLLAQYPPDLVAASPRYADRYRDGALARLD